MSLSLEDRLKQLLPGSFYYRRKIRSELSRGEPEFRLLADLIPDRSGIAVDAGCNRGIYSYVLSGLCRRVLAFEPNPDLVRFARRMLPKNVDLREMALGAAPGRAVLHIPVDARGREDHLKASIATGEDGAAVRRHEVEVRPLDSFDTASVRFIKVDVEGTELEVLAGAASTIARDRPVMLVELFVGHHDPRSAIETICETYGYDAFVATGQGLSPAMPIIDAGGKPPSRNVIFKPA
jgi:FkbM family methyltransferase